MNVEELKAILKESNIKYIEDNLRILIDLDDIYTVESIVTKYNINVLDEITNHIEYGGDGKSYYLVAKPNTPVIKFQDIKTSHCIYDFKNSCIINCDFPYYVLFTNDITNFDYHTHIRKCLPQGIEYKCKLLVESDEIIITLTNAILI